MGTTTIEARCNARPTRLAFIIPGPDRDLLLNVISRATGLWGGMFNPVIILDDSTRIARGVHHEQFPPSQSYIERQEDILRSFDPDILINYSNDPLPDALKHFRHRTYPAARLDWNPWGRQEMSYFVDVNPVLDELWDREFKGNQSPRVKLRFLDKATSETSLFLAARYGLYSNDNAYEFLEKNFAAESFTYDAEFKAALKPGSFHSPLSFTTFHCITRRQHVHSHAFFLLNPEDPFDVMEYWNLRAAGVYLLPFTPQDFKEFENPIKDFGAASAYPINDSITNMPTIIKAPSITDEEHEEVANWIGSQGLVTELSRMGWVPHCRRDMYGVANELEIDPIRAFEGNAVSVLNDGYGKLQGPKPEFLTSQHRHQHWSMDMSFYTYGNTTASYKMPWLNSGCDALVRRKIGSHSDMNATHVSQEGLVSQHDGDDGDVRLSPITSIDVVKAFLEGSGIEYVQTSGPGLALARILEMMGTFHSCEVFQNEAIRQTLEDMAKGDPRTVLSVKISLIQSLKNYTLYEKPATQAQKGERAAQLLNRAIEAKLFKVGLVFQCSRCKRRNWYATTEFTDKYNCKSCFATEETPHIHELEWYLFSDGLFRSTNKLDGNITVLLALNFFDHILDHDLRYAPSFDYRIGDKSNEMDFGIISTGIFREVETIFGESKSGLSLDTDEQAKLKLFGEKTGSYICFCTLSEDFSDDDKGYFRDLYEGGVKIILLTRNLLEMDYFDLLKYKSDKNPGRSKTIPDWLMRLTVINVLGEDFAKKHYIWL
jgi:hypothetical protein